MVDIIIIVILAYNSSIVVWLMYRVGFLEKAIAKTSKVLIDGFDLRKTQLDINSDIVGELLNKVEELEKRIEKLEHQK